MSFRVEGRVTEIKAHSADTQLLAAGRFNASIADTVTDVTVLYYFQNAGFVLLRGLEKR
jgi:hypothetical protein